MDSPRLNEAHPESLEDSPHDLRVNGSSIQWHFFGVVTGNEGGGRGRRREESRREKGRERGGRATVSRQAPHKCLIQLLLSSSYIISFHLWMPHYRESWCVAGSISYLFRLDTKLCKLCRPLFSQIQFSNRMNSQEDRTLWDVEFVESS